MAAEVSVTLKAGGGYDAPWVVVRGTFDEVSEDLKRLTDVEDDVSPLQAVRIIADDFINRRNSRERAIAAVKEVLPTVTEIPAAPSGPPPQQDTPACTKCGSATRFRSGQGTAGAYQGWQCLADKKHFDRVS